MTYIAPDVAHWLALLSEGKATLSRSEMWDIATVISRLNEQVHRSSERTEEGPTPEMVDAALNAWFASPPSETDQGLERSMKAALVAAGIDLSASGRTTYEWRDVAELPPWDEQPGRQFIRLEGSRDHSGVNWHRVYCGIAYIRRLGEPDEMLGYRDTDIIQLCDDGDMDLFSATVTHWMPARFPAIPAPVSGSTEGGNGS